MTDPCPYCNEHHLENEWPTATKAAQGIHHAIAPDENQAQLFDAELFNDRRK